MAKITDDVVVPVKVGFTIDEATFHGCLNLIGMYAKEKDICGMLLDFNSGACDPIMTEFQSLDEMDVLYQAIGAYREKESERKEAAHEP